MSEGTASLWSNEALMRALEPRGGSGELPEAVQTSALYSDVHADMHGEGASDASESELTDTPRGGAMPEGTASLQPNKALTRALGAKDGPIPVAPTPLQSSLQEGRTNTMHVGMDLGGYFMSVVRRVQGMVEREEGVEPSLTETMMALQEGTVGRGKTGFGKTGYWKIEDGLGQGCAAAAIRNKYTTSLIQATVLAC